MARFLESIDLTGNALSNLADAVGDTDAVNKRQVEDAIAAATPDLSTKSLSELAAPTADLDIGGFKLVDVADGTAPTDAATLKQVTDGDAASQAAIAALSLSDLAAAESDLAVGGFKVTNLADGTAPTDAVSKRQLDSAALGIDWKNSVRVVATSDVALTGLQTIDGQALAEGDLVLCVGQTDPTENLAYHASAGAWTVAEQFTQGNLSSGAYVPVEQSSSPGVKYRLATPDPIQVGTTALDWQIADLATTYTGDGETIDVTGGTVKVITTRVVRKLEGTLGDGALTQIPITHNLGTLGVIAQVWDVTSGETVNCGMIRTSPSVMTFRFANAPAADALGFAIHG